MRARHSQASTRRGRCKSFSEPVELAVGGDPLKTPALSMGARMWLKLFKIWTNKCDVGSRSKFFALGCSNRKTWLTECPTTGPALQLRCKVVVSGDADRQEAQLLRLLWLSLLPSLLLSCSLTKGLINSCAGQLNHIRCDELGSADNEEVQEAAPNRGAGSGSPAF